METSDQGIELIALCEGCKLTAHNTWGRWEIGYGQEGWLFPNTPGAIEVVEGLTITQQQADDALRFFVFQAIDPMVRQFFVCQNQAEHDAVASFVYNIRHDKLRRHAYSLPELINKPDRSPDAIDAIIRKWLLYYKTPGAEKGLYRRRILELCRFLDLPWNTPAVLGQLMTINAGDDPEPVFATAEAIYDQMDADSQTAALNNAQLEKLGGTPEQPVPKGTPSVKPKKVKAVVAPKLEQTPEPEKVPMEQSVTHKKLSSADTGKEMAATGAAVGTTVLATVPVMDKVSNYIEGTKPETIYMTLGLGIALFMLIGGIRWWWNVNEAARERQQTTRVKY